MSRFKKLSHTLWHCQYHIVWVPKYRYRILTGLVAGEVARCIRAFSEQNRTEVVELNVQIDHVHLLVLVPPKISISSFVGIVKGRTAIRVFNKFRNLKHKPYWGNHFWARGYCVDTIGLDEEKIRKLCKISGEARTPGRAGQSEILKYQRTGQLPCPLRGQGNFIPFQGLIQYHPLSGWILYEKKRLRSEQRLENGRMAPQGAEQKNGTKTEELMPSNAVP